MPRYVAFLRAINVGGHVVKMEALRTLFEKLGFAGVETFIASGNMIFESRLKNLAETEAKIEGALHKALGYEVSTFIRTLAEVTAIARFQPFQKASMAAAAALNVGFLKAPLTMETRQDLARLRTDFDDFQAHGSELYWICMKRQSESKISNAIFERTLKVKTTLRSLRTMQRLAAKYPD